MQRRRFIETLAATVLAAPMAARERGGCLDCGDAPGAAGGLCRFRSERLYGSSLMTLEERQEHQRRLWAATSAGERAVIRDEHRRRMLARAVQRGVALDGRTDDVFFLPGPGS